MRELKQEEHELVAGGFPGWKIPFGSNSHLPGQPVRLYPANAVVVASFAFQAGWAVGSKINEFNQTQSGMSLGAALFRTFGGGSRIQKHS
ncbi:MAG: hypothetical protein ACJA0W_004240 [Candidatus Azotimanducaceae bacterium]|jgi:hypothetical protein